VTRRTASVPPAWFDTLYADADDPWDFATSDYERAKYQATLAAVGSGHRRALEVGCSIGVLTRQLAARCQQLLAIDVAEAALDQARQRCAGLANVAFQRLRLPDEVPPGCFDLVLLSEVGYYWTAPDLARFLTWLRRALTVDGLFVLVHWTGETDYPLTGDAVHERALAETSDFLAPVAVRREANYRLDALAGLKRRAGPATGRSAPRRDP
jgi:SAM-dependent methyltransferase